MKKLLTLTTILTLAMAIGAQASQKIISFDPIRNGNIEKGVENIGGKVTRRFHTVNALVASFPDDTRDARIYTLSGVTHVSEDRYIKWIDAAPDTMNSVQLPSMDGVLGAIHSGKAAQAPAAARPAGNHGEIPWGVKRVNAAAAWDHTAGQGVKVAIIDTGMDYTHPELAPNYKGGCNIVAGTDDPMDDAGHGTHVSGTIGAVQNGKGVVGVAPKADLYAVKVLDKDGAGRSSWIIAGIEWAIEHRMDVINMSISVDSETDAMEQAMTAANKAGITVVCSAGNDSGSVNYPASYPEAIAVSASDSSDNLASFSSWGPEIAVIAPGSRIYSTKRGGGYTTKSGTSMASPHVAGLAALAIGAGAKTPDDVRKALLAAATPISGLEPEEQGAGMIDASKLVR